MRSATLVIALSAIGCFGCTRRTSQPAAWSPYRDHSPASSRPVPFDRRCRTWRKPAFSPDAGRRASTREGAVFEVFTPARIGTSRLRSASRPTTVCPSTRRRVAASDAWPRSGRAGHPWPSATVLDEGRLPQSRHNLVRRREILACSQSGWLKTSPLARRFWPHRVNWAPRASSA